MLEDIGRKEGKRFEKKVKRKKTRRIAREIKSKKKKTFFLIKIRFYLKLVEVLNSMLNSPWFELMEKDREEGIQKK
jgi:hypothetical protein